MVTQTLKIELNKLQREFKAITMLLIESEDFNIHFIKRKFIKFDENLLQLIKKIKFSCRVHLFCMLQAPKGNKKDLQVKKTTQLLNPFFF